MSTFRDFDAARRERLRALEPIRFRFGGKDFTCVVKPTLDDCFDLAMAPDLPTDETPTLQQVAVLVRFIEALLATDRQRKEFAKLLKRRDDPIDAESIWELGGWLSKEFTNRPLAPTPDSSTGPQPNGASSNGSPFQPVSPT